MAITRWRRVWESDHSPSTETSTVPTGIRETLASVAAQTSSSRAQLARRPSRSEARRCA